jgi:hypothetical protein
MSTDEPNKKPSLEYDKDELKFKSSVPVKWFAFVVDGDVAWMQTVAVELEQLLAVMQSSPQVIQIPEELEGRVMNNGWTYDGENFIPPVM